MQIGIGHSRQDYLVTVVVSLLIAMATIAIFGSALIKLIVMPLLFLLLLVTAVATRERTVVGRKRRVVLLVALGWLMWTMLCLAFLLIENPSGYSLVLVFFGLGTFLASFMAVRLSRRLT